MTIPHANPLPDTALFVPDDEPPLPLPVFVTRVTLPASLLPLSAPRESNQ
jgi:hypothetical protein